MCVRSPTEGGICLRNRAVTVRICPGVPHGKLSSCMERRLVLKTRLREIVRGSGPQLSAKYGDVSSMAERRFVEADTTDRNRHVTPNLITAESP